MFLEKNTNYDCFLSRKDLFSLENAIYKLNKENIYFLL